MEIVIGLNKKTVTVEGTTVATAKHVWFKGWNWVSAYKKRQSKKVDYTSKLEALVAATKSLGYAPNFHSNFVKTVGL